MNTINLSHLLHDKGLLPDSMIPVMRAEAEPAPELPAEVAVAVHRLVARSPCRLVVVAAEDLAGQVEQVNVPGTVDEHPNWKRRLPVAIEDLAGFPMFDALTAAMREERPRED